MTMSTPRLRALTLCIALALPVGAACAQDAMSESELVALVRAQAEQLRQQSEQIAAMNARLAALEGGTRTAAVASTTTPATAVDPVQAQVDAAIADTRQDDDLAILQAQVAQLAATGTGSGGGNVSWRRGGPTFRSADREFSFHPRGRIMADYAATRGSNYDARNIQGTEMRAVRLGAEGQIGAVGYKVDVDFADNVTSVKDAYLSYDTRLFGVPAEIHLGNKLKDRAIDSATTLVRTPFMERNAVASVGMPNTGYFGLGAQLKLLGNGWHASIGVAGEDVDNVGNDDDSVAWNARAHWNPIRGADGFVHVGGWYWTESLSAPTAINRTPRIALDFNDNVRVSASSIANVTDNHAYGAELGGVWRNLWGFGEYTERTLKSTTVGDVEQRATSLYAGWLITGERAAFSQRSGVWGTTRVLKPLGKGGWGAFELALRYDDYDFTDAARGGEGDSWTLGLNWYLNDWTRLMVNYVHWTTENRVGAYQGRDTGNTLGVRAQVAF